MNNVECNVVRDLMPLCIDSAASEESRKLVVEHVWKCKKCSEVYKEMQGHLLPGQKDDTDYLDAAARKMRRKRQNRKRLLIALSCMITALVVMLGIWGYDYATSRSAFPIALSEYEVSLSRSREGGRIFMTVDMEDKFLRYGLSMRGQKEATGNVYLISVNTTMIRRYSNIPNPRVQTDEMTDWYWIDGKIYMGNPAKVEPVTAIRVVCGKDEKTIYQLGDDIPMCSEEMEAYYKAWDEYHAYDNPSNRREFDFYEKRNELREHATELAQYIPEWQ